MTFEQFFTLAERFGFPSAICAIIILFLFLTGRGVYNRLLMPLFKVFLDMIAKLDILNEKNSNSIEQLADSTLKQKDLLMDLVDNKKEVTKDIKILLMKHAESVEKLVEQNSRLIEKALESMSHNIELNRALDARSAKLESLIEANRTEIMVGRNETLKNSELLAKVIEIIGMRSSK